MKQIAIIHPDLTAKGGAEAVAVQVLEALQSDYDVSLLTVTSPSLSELNDYYNSNVHDVTIRRAGPLTRWFNAIAEKKMVDLPVPRCRLFEQALFNRFVKRVQSEYDLVFSTYNEYRLDPPSIQYIHHPNYYLWQFPGSEEIGRVGRAQSALSRHVSGFTQESLSSSVLIANSAWTGREFDRIYGHRPSVIHPPVDTSGFEDIPWDERENGFVVISRISPDKEVHKGIEIVDELVERGHNIHLHVVGSITSDEYHEQILDAATNSSHIHIEGELPRTELVTLVNEHKYGLHTKPYEHFGIAVAELVAGGMIPFVPSSGGQVEIVDNDTLTYSSVSEAVETVSRVIESPARQEELRRRLPEIESKFGRERFRREIKSLVESTL